MHSWKISVSAVLLLASSALATTASADNRSFKANFTLHADSAIVSGSELRLLNVNPVVFVVESSSDIAYGITESAVSFLERWAMLDHEIRPQGVLFTNAEQHGIVYRASRFEIDNPSQAANQSEVDWVFEINHLVSGAREHFAEARAHESVTLTIVMEHTQPEVSEGRVCGPWDPTTLKEHHQLLKQ
jgi:hypothetical protein